MAISCGRLDPPDKQETVILIHGMGRTTNSMTIMAHRLRKDGYRVLYFGYREKNDTLVDIAAQLKSFTEQQIVDESYYLVAHSLGNIVIREAFREKWESPPTRIVMLAPPNQPADLAKRLKTNAIYKWRTGDCGACLADPNFYETLPVPTVPFGVIAGTLGQSWTFDEPNDGIVAVSTTAVDGMTDFVTVHHTHTFMKHCTDTYNQVKSFLVMGRFIRGT